MILFGNRKDPRRVFDLVEDLFLFRYKPALKSAEDESNLD